MAGKLLWKRKWLLYKPMALVLLVVFEQETELFDVDESILLNTN